MYAVIFTAKTKEVDSEYLTMTNRMRTLATEKYGCVDFVPVSERKQELAISYWPSVNHIEKWKNDPEHIKTQALGKQRWYSEYKVQIVQIEREYKARTK